MGVPSYGGSLSPLVSGAPSDVIIDVCGAEVADVEYADGLC